MKTRIGHGLLSCVLFMGVATTVACAAKEPAPVVRTTPLMPEFERIVGHDAVLAERARATADGFVREGAHVTSPGYRSARQAPLLELGARLPEHADGAWEIGIGQSEATTMRLRPEHASSSPIALDGGRAVYRDAFPSTDAIVATGRSYAEWFYVLRDEKAPHAFSFRVELPSGMSAHRDDDGGLTFDDRNGSSRFHIASPYAIDSKGVTRPARLSYAEGRLALELDTRELQYPIVLDPVVETTTWEQQVALDPRADAAMAQLGTKVVLFGGYVGGTNGSDTWEWDGAIWSLKTPTTKPSARASHQMATLGTKVVLFGGGIYDTWEWDGTNWTKRTPTTSPNAEGVLVAYAGKLTLVTTNLIWEWDGTNWTSKNPTTKPPARSGFAATTLGTKVVLFGGQGSSTGYNDTWEWDGTNWTARTPTTKPSIRAKMRLATVGTRAILFGGEASYSGVGETWEWDGTNWTLKTTPTGLSARGSYAMTSLGSSALLFGGSTDSGWTQFGDTWEWSGTAWSKKSDGVPSKRAHLQMATLGTKVVAYGGCLADGSACSRVGDDTWEFDGTKWSLKTPTTTPGGRAKYALATLGTKAVLFGGCTPYTCSNLVNETWEWDGTNWAKRTTTTAPIARINARMVSTATGKLVLFGGATSSATLGDTWEWDGTSWTERSPTTSPPARQLHGFATAAGKSTVFGGCTDLACATRLADTWDWDGTNWTARTLTTAPSARWGHTLVTVGSNAILFGGCTLGYCPINQAQNDTWQFDGTSWYQFSITTAPQKRSSHAMAVLGANALMFGGLFIESSGGSVGGWRHLNDTWLLKRTYLPAGQACDNPTDCSSGFCVDGFCCDKACNGTCESCAAALKTTGADGVCGPSKVGSDPGNKCKDTGAACLQDGVCDGAGACRKYPSSTCTINACTTNDDCASGFCVEGICCDKKCDRACEGCTKLSKGFGRDGVCEPLVAGSGAKAGSTCPKDSGFPSSCKADGLCDGAGACRVYATNTTACGTATCSAGNVSGMLCDGSGTCVTGNRACAPYQCKDGTACATSCAADTDCAATHFCATSVCAPKKANGDSAADPRECTSGFLADGLCCNRACTGTCEACDKPESKGACALVVGAPKHGMCPGAPTGGDACMARTCDGATGTTCNGYVGGEVICRMAGCRDGTAVSEAKCEGKGACPAEVAPPCVPYACAGAACKTSCTGDTDCAPGNVCITSTGKCESGSRCDGDHTVSAPGGVKTDCSPFACNEGRCKSDCAISSDCAPSFICDPATKKCGKPPSGDAGDSGGCAMGGTGSNTAFVTLVGLLIALGSRGRRRGA